MPKQTFTLEQIEEAMSEMTGFCIYCGAESGDMVEPDARGYDCDECEKPGVYGAEELLMMGRVG